MALVAQYEQLFEKKPAHNIGIEKLKTQIAEKEAELAQVEKPTIQDTTETQDRIIPEVPVEDRTNGEQ